MKRFRLHRTMSSVAWLFGFILLFGCSNEDHQIQGTFQGTGEAETWIVDRATCEPDYYLITQTGEITVTGQQIGTTVTGTLDFPELLPGLPLAIFGTNVVIGGAGHLNFRLDFVRPDMGSRYECSGVIIATDLTEDKIADSLQIDPFTRSACITYVEGECVNMYIIKSGELLSYSYQNQ